MEEQILQAWQIHNRIQLYVLEALSEEWLGDASLGRGRTVGDHFAHMHNVRLMWLKASAPALMAGQEKLEKENSGNKELLASGLTASGVAIEELIKQAIANGGKVKGFKPNVVAFLGYLVSHESFHAGKIDLILRQAGHPIDDKVHFGMWEWGTR